MRQACIPGARRCRPRRTTSCGAFLIEALVAVLVFSVAAAGVFSLLANGLRASDNARSRTEASDVAAATLARMSTEDIVTLADRYDALGGGSGFRTLLASARRLPGVTDTANVPVVTFAPGPSARSQRVSVTVYWQLAGRVGTASGFDDQRRGASMNIVGIATRTNCRRRIGRERSHEPSSVGAASDRGVTLVDVLVGLAVAMLTVVVVYQTFVVVESIRRSAAAAADTQGSGAFALFALAVQTENAGAGLASAARWLDTCPPTADIATTLRPIDVLITDGGGADRPDSLVIRQSRASNGAAPAAFAAAAPPGADFRVESADGFSIADRVIAISRTGSCAMAEITAVVRSADPAFSTSRIRARPSISRPLRCC